VTYETQLLALVCFTYRVYVREQDERENQMDQTKQSAGSSWSELPFSQVLRYSDTYEIGGVMITPDVLTEYVRNTMPDAAVTVSDRTGTMDHLKVVVISAAFAGKNLLDRHRMIFQALDAPMKDGRIHALEITAKTTDEA
jgi:stress-induced morphogen